MLVLSRKSKEQILIGDNIILTIVEIRGGKVRIGIEAPIEVPITRPDAKSQKPKETPLGRKSA